MINKTNMEKQPTLVGWLKLLIGLTALIGVVWFFSTGYTPPGIFGEVIRHNQAHQIDASPFFYGDVENITELEEGLKEIIANNKNSR